MLYAVKTASELELHVLMYVIALTPVTDQCLSHQEY